MSATRTAPRSLWLVAGIVLVLAGAGAVTFGVLDGEAEAAGKAAGTADGNPDAASGPPRADTRLGFLLGGLLTGAAGLLLVYRCTT